MQIQVVQDFRCFDGLGTEYSSGSVVEVGEQYAADCFARGLAKPVEPAESKPAKKVKQSAESES